MKTRFICVSLWLAALILPVPADTFVMKDGTSIEGTLFREDVTSYTIELQVTSTIKDERVVAKADVTTIKKENPENAAFEAISSLTPTPDALPSEEYSKRISTVEKYLSDYRGGSKSTEAKAMLATLKAEANEILAGGVKVNGKIVSPSEYRANAYGIDARMQAARINLLIRSARYLEALRAFSAFDRDFRNTSAHAELLPLITRVIQIYLTEVNQSLASFDAQTKQRGIGLERMPMPARRETANAITQENAALEERFKAEMNAKVGWVTTHPLFKPSLEQNAGFGKQELTRLAAQEKAPVADGERAYRDALSQIQSGGTQAAITAAIASAKSAGVAQRYIDNLETSAKASGPNP